MSTIKKYLSLVKFSHTIFAMPFALIGFFLAMAKLNPAWNLNEAILRAGCGITADSVFEDEKQEAENKMKAIQEILSL